MLFFYFVSRFTCKICAVSTTSQRALILHMCTMEHQATKAWIREAFVCADCGACFSNRDAYAMHVMLRAQNDSCVPSTSANEESIKNENQPSSLDTNVRLAIQTVSADRTDDGNNYSYATKTEALSSPRSSVSSHSHELLVVDECAEDRERIIKEDTIDVRNNTESDPSETGEAGISNEQHLVATMISNSNMHFIKQSLLHGINKHTIVFNNDHQTPHLLKTWLCYKCGQVFDTCDTLAMHAMDCHASSNKSTRSIPIDRLQQANLTENIDDEDIGSQRCSSSSAFQPFNAYRALLFESALAQKLLHNISVIPTAKRRSPFSMHANNSLLKQNLNVMQQGTFASGHLSFSVGKHDNGSSKPNVSINDAQSDTSSDTIRKILATAKQLMKKETHEQVQGTTSCLKSDTNVNVDNKTSSADRAALPRANEAIAQPNETLNLAIIKSDLVNDTQDQSNINSSSISTTVTNMSSNTNKVNNIHNRVFEKEEGENATNSLITEKVKFQTKEMGTSEHKFTSHKKRKYDDAFNNLYDNNSSIQCNREDNTQKNKLMLITELSASQINKEILNESGELDGSGNVENDIEYTNVSLHKKQLYQPTGHIFNQFFTALCDKSINSIENDYYGKIVVKEENQQESSSSLRADGDEKFECGKFSNENKDKTAIEEDENDENVLQYVSRYSNSAVICRHCKLVFIDRTLYHLHMGLHNLNNPWQCNLCGHVCQNCHDFSTHVLHFADS